MLAQFQICRFALLGDILVGEKSRYRGTTLWTGTPGHRPTLGRLSDRTFLDRLLFATLDTITFKVHVYLLSTTKARYASQPRTEHRQRGTTFSLQPKHNSKLVFSPVHRIRSSGQTLGRVRPLEYTFLHVNVKCWHHENHRPTTGIQPASVQTRPDIVAPFPSVLALTAGWHVQHSARAAP